MKYHPIKIAVCLSVYNGSLYLQEQLISIENQSCDLSQMILFIRDDGSSDESNTIIQSFTRRSPLKIMVLSDKTNLGVKKSFEFLMSKAIDLDAKYIMFCDQDDVWHKDKIEKSYRIMEQQESMYGKNTPILVHSNLTVVNSNLNVIAPSFWKYQYINPYKDKLADLLLQNIVTGCTMMINRVLAEKVRTIPAEAIMHDWWIAMVASAFGQITFINEPLIFYRQHGKNDTGAKKYGIKYIANRFFIKLFTNRYSSQLDKYILQGDKFLKIYENDLDEKNKAILKSFQQFPNLTKFQRIIFLFEHNVWKNGLIRNIGLLLFV